MKRLESVRRSRGSGTSANGRRRLQRCIPQRNGRELDLQTEDLARKSAEVEQQRAALTQAQGATFDEGRRLEAERLDLKAMRESIAERERHARLLIRDRIAAFELLAATWAEWAFVQGERRAFDLLYKPHPAVKAADAVAAQARRAAPQGRRHAGDAPDVRACPRGKIMAAAEA